MSYCMFRNTLNDLNDVAERIDSNIDNLKDFLSKKNSDEIEALKELFETINSLVEMQEEVMEAISEIEMDNDYADNYENEDDE